jgi:hypothetical protein
MPGHRPRFVINGFYCFKNSVPAHPALVVAITFFDGHQRSVVYYLHAISPAAIFIKRAAFNSVSSHSACD